ncbi:MAG: Crp/Fnr family transcriptional regulator [Hyphomicrobium sp.]
MASVTEIADLLQAAPIFAEMSAEDRAFIAKQMREVSVAPGQMLFARGDAGRSIYLVLQGRVRLSVVSSDGRELSYLHAGRGQLFGEIAAIDGGERTTDAKAVSQVRLMQLDAPALMRFFETNPAFALACCRFLCRRLRGTNTTLESVALHPIEVRVARYLLSQVKRNSGPAPAQVRLTGLLSQSELALLIGASRPRVNLAMQLLEDMGAIQRDGDGTVCMLKELEDVAQVGSD